MPLFEKVAHDDPTFHLGLAGLAEAYRWRYTLDHNRKWVDLALAGSQPRPGSRLSLESVYVTLGRVHNSTGQYEVAREEFERALNLAPRDADAIQGMAQAYQKTGTAIGRRNRCFSGPPRFNRTRGKDTSAWANFYYNVRRYPEAEPQYRRVLELVPDNAAAYTNLGTVADEREPIRRSAQGPGKAVALNPTYSAYNNLGDVYYLEGHYAEAAANYEKALRLNNDDYRVWGNLGAAYAAAPALVNRSAAAFEKPRIWRSSKREGRPMASFSPTWAPIMRV